MQVFFRTTRKWNVSDFKCFSLQFVIEGVIGKPSNAYIAIDDISLVEGTCKSKFLKKAH